MEGGYLAPGGGGVVFGYCKNDPSGAVRFCVGFQSVRAGIVRAARTRRITWET